MKKFAIFALFLFVGLSCHEATIEKCHCFVTISDALPIQFWLTGCSSYNTRNKCGVHDVCFCQPVECDDEINIQFTDDSDADYYLGVYDEDGNEISYQLFSIETTMVTQSISLQFSNTGQLFSSIDSWQSFPGDNRSSAEPFFYNGTFGELWADATSSGSSSGYENSQYLAASRPDSALGWPPGNYVVRIRAANASDGDADAVGITAWGMLDSTTQISIVTSASQNLPRDSGFYNVDVSFTIDQYYPYIAFAFTRLGGGGTFDILVAVQGISITSAPTTEEVIQSSTYKYSFVPSDLGVCDERMQLKIFIDSSPDEEVAYTDCIDVATDHGCTTLIEYSNARNFAGIIYEDESPDQTFRIRLPAIFFEEREIEEDESMELPNSVLSLNSQTKTQRLLSTASMPHYMHRKTQLILMHQSISSDGLEWVKEEAYEKQDGDRRWPLRKAKCWLTDKNSVQRNIL